MDRPRRALFEEPDNVESYVAKRSLGITQADTGDRSVVRPARATRALEPGAAGNQAQVAGRDQLGRSHPPTPRRALPAESLSWDLEAPKASPTEPAAAGRRAIVDLEQTPGSGPVDPTPPPPQTPVVSRPLEPRGIEPSPLREAAGDLPKIIAAAEPPPDPIFVPAPPAPTTPVPIPMPTPTDQQQLYWPALPVDPTPPPRQTPVVSRPVPQTRHAEPAAAGRRAIVDLEQTPVSGPVVPSQPTVPLAVRPAALEPGLPTPPPPQTPVVSRPVPQTRHAEPVRALLPERTPTPRRPVSIQTVDRAAASS